MGLDNQPAPVHPDDTAGLAEYDLYQRRVLAQSPAQARARREGLPTPSEFCLHPWKRPCVTTKMSLSALPGRRPERPQTSYRLTPIFRHSMRPPPPEALEEGLRGRSLPQPPELHQVRSQVKIQGQSRHLRHQHLEPPKACLSKVFLKAVGAEPGGKINGGERSKALVPSLSCEGTNATPRATGPRRQPILRKRDCRGVVVPARACTNLAGSWRLATGLVGSPPTGAEQRLDNARAPRGKPMASQVQEGVILQEHSAPISCPTPNFAKIGLPGL